MNSNSNISDPASVTTLYSTLEKRTEQNNIDPYLVILSGPDQGKQYHLHRQFNSLGRNNDVDISIMDLKVSRNHGTLIIYPDCIVLKDNQSTNGCYINDIRIESQEVEVGSRIRIGSTIMKIEYKKASEVQLEKALYKAANTDSLTKIFNRHAFMCRAEEDVLSSILNNESLTIMMCDVDHFKRINDSFGHLAGDRILIDLAELLQAQMRKGDMLARYGGEEFIMLLRNENIDFITKLAERIRVKVEECDFSFEDTLIPTTLSIGVCSRKGKEISSLSSLIKEADNALYQAKNNGRNRVEVC